MNNTYIGIFIVAVIVFILLLIFIDNFKYVLIPTIFILVINYLYNFYVNKEKVGGELNKLIKNGGSNISELKNNFNNVLKEIKDSQSKENLASVFALKIHNRVIEGMKNDRPLQLTYELIYKNITNPSFDISKYYTKHYYIKNNTDDAEYDNYITNRFKSIHEDGDDMLFTKLSDVNNEIIKLSENCIEKSNNDTKTIEDLKEETIKLKQQYDLCREEQSADSKKYQNELNELNKIIDNLNESKLNLEKQITTETDKQLDIKLENCKDENTKLLQDIDACKKDVLSLSTETEIMEDKISDLETKKNNIENDLEILKSDNIKLEKDLEDTLTNEKDLYMKEISVMRDELDTLKSKLDKKELELSDLTNLQSKKDIELESYQIKLKNLEMVKEELESVNSKLSDVMSELDDCKNNLNKCMTDKDKIKIQLDEKEKELDTVYTKFKKCVTDEENIKKELDICEKKVDILNTKSDTLTTEIENLNTDRMNILQQLDSANSDKDMLNTKLSDLENSLNSKKALLEKCNKDLEYSNNFINELNEKLVLTQTELEETRITYKENYIKWQEEKDRLEQIHKDEQDKLNMAIENNLAKINILEGAKSKCLEELNSTTEKLDNTIIKLDTAKKENEDLSNRLNLAETELFTTKDKLSFTEQQLKEEKNLDPIIIYVDSKKKNDKKDTKKKIEKKKISKSEKEFYNEMKKLDIKY